MFQCENLSKDLWSLLYDIAMGKLKSPVRKKSSYLQFLLLGEVTEKERDQQSGSAGPSIGFMRC